MKLAQLLSAFIIGAGATPCRAEDKLPQASPVPASPFPGMTNIAGRIEIRRAYYSDKLTVSKDVLSLPVRRKPELFAGRNFEYSGPAVHLIRTPGRNIAQMVKHPLQLINPFAPMEYGTGDNGRNEWNAWNPFVGTRPLPHAFRDPMTHEPQGVLISVGR